MDRAGRSVPAGHVRVRTQVRRVQNLENRTSRTLVQPAQLVRVRDEGIETSVLPHVKFTCWLGPPQAWGPIQPMAMIRCASHQLERGLGSSGNKRKMYQGRAQPQISNTTRGRTSEMRLRLSGEGI